MATDLSTVVSKSGFWRLAVELLVLFGVVTLLFVWVVGPWLQAVAPETYTTSGLDYSRIDHPDTALEWTHLLVSLVTGGGFLYWRLRFTTTGRAFGRAVRNGRRPDSDPESDANSDAGDRE